VPIRILDAPDPFTAASRARPDRPFFIESDAYRQLVHELRRYCRLEVHGRSFLLAGHRGAGKTTLVASALETLLREHDEATARISGSAPMLRPLPVLLQGPMLLPVPNSDTPIAPGAGEAPRRMSDVENVLVQITLGLHRALAREIVMAFRAHMLRAAPGPDERDALELAAQLQLELDDYTGKARLRDLWRRAGALTHGVLYALAAQHQLLHDDGDARAVSARRVAGQGARELVALASVCDAYRRISGSISRKNEFKASASQQMERSLDASAKGGEVATPILAALTGASVGTGAAVLGDAAASTAAFVGVITALASMVLGKLSITHKRDRATSLEDLFIPDLSVATMDRILPVLLDRIREAGLAPVFVVDELDKVDRLSDRIQDMIRQLKKLVAENACFCFLVDRSYFEEMRQRTTRTAYSIEHTYFTHQLFIAFRHTDIRRYLERLLERPAGTGVASIKEEQADHAVLPYILTHSAQLHPIDLVRQIAALRDPDGALVLPTGLVRSKPRYQLELLMQLAVEWQLEEDAMQVELDRRPAFRRLAHDALYYISRQWEQDDELLNLDKAGRALFEQYLINRMSLTPPEAQPSSPIAPLIALEDLNFLWSAVQALARSLLLPASIQAEYERRGTNEVIIAAVREAVNLGPLFEAIPLTPEVYRWRFRRSGRRAMPPPTAAVPPPSERTAALPTQPSTTTADAHTEPAWSADAALIREFERTLKETTGDTIDPSVLSAGLGILPTSPAWPQVHAALQRLEVNRANEVAYPDVEEDLAVVRRYRAVLSENVPAAAMGIMCGLILKDDGQEPTALLRERLEQIAYVLGLHDLSPTAVADAVSQLYRELGERLPVRPPLREELTSDEWLRWLRAGAGDARDLRPVRRPADAAATWEYFRVKVHGKRPKPTLGIVADAVKRAGGFATFKLPLEAMTLRDWSLAFYRSVSGDAPSWVAVAALRALGWHTRMKGLAHLMITTRFFKSDVRQLDEPIVIEGVPNESLPLNYVFVAGEQGLSEQWRSDPGCAALVLRAREWAFLRTDVWGADHQIILEWFAPDILIVDATGPGIPRPGEAVAQWADVFAATYRSSKTLRALPIIMHDPQGGVRPPYVAVPAARSLSDLLGYIRSLLRS
jgi:hypothetical protein